MRSPLEAAEHVPQLARSAQLTSSFIVASCGLLPGPAHEFLGSRKLRLAPQDYSPWTPPTDRLSGRSYPPASRHPRVLDLVGPYYGVQCHPERSEPASEVEGSAPRRVERLGSRILRKLR